MELHISHDADRWVAGMLPKLQPWMHPYRFSENVFTGHYKYHKIAETFCTPDSPPALIEQFRHAFSDYSSGRPFWVLDQVLALLPQEKSSCSFLDIGCATGRFSFYLASQKVGSVRGVEIRPHQVEQCNFIKSVDARFKDAPVRFDHVAESADDIRFLEGESFDVVLSLGVLYHLEKPVQHLRNVRRLTRYVAVIHTLTHSAAPVGFWKLIHEDPNWITKASSGVSWVPHVFDVENLLRHAGFARVEQLVHPDVAPFQSALIGRRKLPETGRIVRLVKGGIHALTPRFLRERRARFESLRLQWVLERYQNPYYHTYLAFV